MKISIQVLFHANYRVNDDLMMTNTSSAKNWKNKETNL